MFTIRRNLMTISVKIEKFTEILNANGLIWFIGHFTPETNKHH